MFYIKVSIPICGEQTGNELKLQPLNPTQHWSSWSSWGCPTPDGSPRRSNCLGIWSSKSCHASTCLGIRQSRGPRRSSRLNLPRDPIPRRPSGLNLPRDLISPDRRLSRLSLPGDLHPDPGMRGSQVPTVLGRVGFRKTLLMTSTHGN